MNELDPERYEVPDQAHEEEPRKGFQVEFVKDEFPQSPEVQAAADAALTAISERSAGERSGLGKMINCQFCNRRHRKYERKCEQVFTNKMKDEKGVEQEYFIDDENGEKVPQYRTAVDEGSQPTINQIMGAKTFKGKRRQPRPNPKDIPLVNLTREIYAELTGTFKNDQEKMVAARKKAIKQLKAPKDKARKLRNKRALISRKINRGILPPGFILLQD